MPPILRSFTFRLALLYSVLALGSMLSLLGFIYWATSSYMDRQVNETINEEIQALAAHYRAADLPGLTQAIKERVASDPSQTGVYLLVDAHHRFIVGNLGSWPHSAPDEDGWLQFQLWDWAPSGLSDHQARARSFSLNDDLHLLVGRDVWELDATRRLIHEALGWGSLMTLVLALGIGLLMSSRVTHRIEAINRTSREIMQGRLSERIPTTGGGDDFDQLAVNLNTMLDRIEALMESVRQVSDNIAHDLRTPLTRLRNRLEQGLREEVNGPAIEQAISDADELLATFSALLRIARIESDSGKRAFAELELGQLVEGVLELYQPLAEEKQQRISASTEPGLTLLGDRNLLFQAVANLVDNAIKHTPSSCAISLAAQREGDAICLEIADTGPGVAEEHRDKVLQRFYRTDSSRTTPGSGLGLSLVSAIVKLHKANIVLEDNEPGLRVRLLLAREKRP